MLRGTFIMKNWLNLNNKVVIITGGSSGIGKSIVNELQQQQANVIIADINPCDDFSSNSNVHFVKTDIGNTASINQLVDWTIQKFGSIDAVINNAGINYPRLLVDAKSAHSDYELNEQAFDLMVNINQKGTFLLSQAVARHMIPRKTGVIINLSSESGLEGSEGQSCYAATKAALYSFTRSWAKELGKFNLRVVGVAPGILEKTGLRTDAYENALAYTRNISVEQLRKGYTNSSIPIGRDGKLTEVANLVAFLISDRAGYITGVTYNIAGGKTRG